jgi:hypothetical protein
MITKAAQVSTAYYVNVFNYPVVWATGLQQLLGVMHQCHRWLHYERNTTESHTAHTVSISCYTVQVLNCPTEY